MDKRHPGARLLATKGMASVYSLFDIVKILASPLAIAVRREAPRVPDPCCERTGRREAGELRDVRAWKNCVYREGNR